MRVKLIEHTPTPEEIVARAFRSCHAKDASDKLDLEKPVEYYIKKAKKLGHLSVIEHASFTFSVEGVSRSCTHQLVRHRLASYSQQSMRYVNLSELDYNDFVTPKTIKENDAEEEYKELLESTISTYKKLLEKGVPKEDARFVLPIASPTNITVTMNGRELLHFLDLRLEENAQWEIREVAKRMLEEVKDVAPNIFSEDI